MRLDEAAFLIGSDRSPILREDAERDRLYAHLVERVAQREPHRFCTEPLAELASVEDRDADLVCLAAVRPDR